MKRRGGWAEGRWRTRTYIDVSETEGLRWMWLLAMWLTNQRARNERGTERRRGGGRGKKWKKKKELKQEKEGKKQQTSRMSPYDKRLTSFESRPLRRACCSAEKKRERERERETCQRFTASPTVPRLVVSLTGRLLFNRLVNNPLTVECNQKELDWRERERIRERESEGFYILPFFIMFLTPFVPRTSWRWWVD